MGLGLGVGSTLAQLKKAYRSLRVLTGEGSTYVVVERKALPFELDTEPPKRPSGESVVKSTLVLGRQ